MSILACRCRENAAKPRFNFGATLWEPMPPRGAFSSNPSVSQTVLSAAEWNNYEQMVVGFGRSYYRSWFRYLSFRVCCALEVRFGVVHDRLPIAPASTASSSSRFDGDWLFISTKRWNETRESLAIRRKSFEGLSGCDLDPDGCVGHRSGIRRGPLTGRGGNMRPRSAIRFNCQSLSRHDRAPERQHRCGKQLPLLAHERRLGALWQCRDWTISASCINRCSHLGSALFRCKQKTDA